MKFHFTNLETCHAATGVVVVVDVIRAFTNAAFAFSRGAREIHPVSGVEEALQLKARMPNSLVCGEVGGTAARRLRFWQLAHPNQHAGFNMAKPSSSALAQGHRVSSEACNAGTMLAASFVVAQCDGKIRPQACAGHCYICDHRSNLRRRRRGPCLRRISGSAAEQ